MSALEEWSYCSCWFSNYEEKQRYSRSAWGLAQNCQGKSIDFNMKHSVTVEHFLTISTIDRSKSKEDLEQRYPCLFLHTETIVLS